MCEMTPERRNFLQGEINGNNLDGLGRADRLATAINTTKFPVSEQANFEESILSQIVSVLEQNCPEN